MFVKITTVNTGGKTYRYASLVESYRRKSDNRPVHRVVAKLGPVSEELGRNLQLAYRAAEKGETLVCASELQDDIARPLAHYTYLDVAVLLRLWRQWGLGELLGNIAHDDRRQMPFEDVVFALVAHRCIDPGSKIDATRWYPQTALPELLGHQASSLNNTRLHRGLDRLAEVEDQLQDQLSRRVVEQRGDYSALFIDLTDTWFVNEGCDLAEQRKTKEGLWRFKIGIALLCTPEGFPVRWKVVAGRSHEAETVLEVGQWLRQSGLPEDRPVVVDRIMGTLTPLSEMKQQSIRYVTALRSTTIDNFAPDEDLFSWTDQIDVDAEDAIEKAAQLAREAGMIPVRRELWALDLGVIDPVLPTELKPSPHIERSQDALDLARTIQEKLDNREARLLKDAASLLEITAERASQLRTLLKLTPAIQQRIDEGDNPVSVSQLTKIARLPPDSQWEHYQQALAKAPVREPVDATSRIVIYFHPQGFVRSRHKMAEHWADLHTDMEDLNRRLATPQSRRDEASIENEIRSKMLKPRGLQTSVDINIETYELDGRLRYRAQVRQSDTGRRKAERDGFFCLAAHPDVELDEESMSELYSAKNMIECDFKVIKSVLELRPIYHRTDPKVRAHVSLCMLALLLQRALEQKYDGPRMTASRLLESLSAVHLNAIELKATKDRGMYTLTQPSAEQLETLEKLEMTDLVDQETLPQGITPR